MTARLLAGKLYQFMGGEPRIVYLNNFNGIAHQKLMEKNCIFLLIENIKTKNCYNNKSLKILFDGKICFLDYSNKKELEEYNLQRVKQ